MLMPKRVKFRRVQRGRLKGKASRGNTVTNGAYGLVALEPAWITANQIEAARIAMTRYIKRGGKVCSNPCGLKGYQAVGTVSNGIAAGCLTLQSSALYATEFNSLRH